MPASNQGWPEDFGFQLGGSGPSYILWVEEGSSAHLAGLQAGDQVLEIEGHNVSTLAPQAVIAIAQTQKNIPPSIGVVSRIQQVQFSSPPVPEPDGHVFICSCIHLYPSILSHWDLEGASAAAERWGHLGHLGRRVTRVAGSWQRPG